MKVKTDTKEKFTVITPVEPHLYDNMAADLAATCNKCLETSPKNVILNLESVTAVDDACAMSIAQLQETFYEKSVSFVICEVKPMLEDIFEKLEILDVLNITPTESEAWDIVQMEEIERELMDGEDVEFDVEDDK